MWRKYLSHPWCIPALALLGMLLTAPTLSVGLFADDYIHRSLLVGEAGAPHSGSLFGLFNFMDGQAAHIHAMKVSGRMLWWAADAMRLSFWRPLSELTHWLDYQLWPTHPALMHAQNLGWYGLLILLLGRLYRLLNPEPRQASLATMVFAFSSLHMQVVGWIAARNQLISACFVVLTLMAFHTWRSRRSIRHAWLAAGSFTLGLMSAEAAIAALGYLVAYSLVLDKGRWPARLRALWPFVAIVVVWRLSYNHLSFGSVGSGAYIDPGSNVPRFGMALLVRLPDLMLADLLRVPSGIINGWGYGAQGQYALAATGLIGVLAALGQYFKLWAAPLARFYALGALAALVPACAAEPSDRLLINAEIGLSALMALLFCQAAAQHRLRSGWLSKGAKGAVWLLLGLHLIASPIQTLAYSLLMERLLTPTTLGEPLSLPAARPLGPEHVILLNPPKPSMLFYYPSVRQLFGLRNPASIQALASGNQALTLTVVDAASIRLSGPKGFMDSMSRDIVTQPFRAGDTVDIGAVVVTVQAVSPEGVPLSALFRFKAPLSDSQWHFYIWDDAGYKPFAMPAIGQMVVLPAMDPGKLLMHRLKPTTAAPLAHINA